MNPQPNDDLQRRLEKLEAEINSPSGMTSQSQAANSQPNKVLSFFSYHTSRVLAWYKTQSGIKKIIVLGVGFLLAFSLLQAVFKLVAAVISLAVLSILVYVGYKFFISSNSQLK
ncbi:MULTISPECIES: hypothetical protein [Nostocales]|uniref:Uncharacterized protein n=3 Tax=Nostocales TaxID=1161 RepID=A0A0C1R337_9CYAN|nr:hypothetical protein [Tolypothrix bouteillei]KAF3886174.1 hypothetical protein DA73_0400012350 [Tolypothrix bouteillei VB521301]